MAGVDRTITSVVTIALFLTSLHAEHLRAGQLTVRVAYAGIAAVIRGKGCTRDAHATNTVLGADLTVVAIRVQLTRRRAIDHGADQRPVILAGAGITAIVRGP